MWPPLPGPIHKGFHHINQDDGVKLCGSRKVSRCKKENQDGKWELTWQKWSFNNIRTLAFVCSKSNVVRPHFLMLSYKPPPSLLPYGVGHFIHCIYDVPTTKRLSYKVEQVIRSNEMTSPLNFIGGTYSISTETWRPINWGYGIHLEWSELSSCGPFDRASVIYHICDKGLGLELGDKITLVKDENWAGLPRPRLAQHSLEWPM